MEKAKFQSNMMHEIESINSIQSNVKPTSRRFNQNFSPSPNNIGFQKKFEKNENKKVIKCDYCGTEHSFGKNNCPASGKRCNKCKERNHFAKVCKSARTNVTNAIRTEDDELHDRADTPNDDYCFSVNNQERNLSLPVVRVKLDGNDLGKVKLRFNRLTSQNCKSIKRDFLKIILELLKRSIV